MNNPDDAALLAGVKAGKPDYPAIIRMYDADVRAAAQGILGSRARAGLGVDDAVQDAWAEVWAKKLLTPDIDDLRAFLKTVAARRALDIVKKGRRSTPEAEPTEDKGQTDDVLDRMTNRVAAEQLMGAAWDELHRLSPAQREAFHRRLNGQEWGPIGDALGVTGQRAGQLFREALGILRSVIQPRPDSD